MATAESAPNPACRRRAPPPPNSPPREAVEAAAALVAADSSTDERASVSPSSPSPVDALAALMDESRDQSSDDPGDDESHDEGLLAIGESSEALDPTAGRCWSCLVDLRRGVCAGGGPSEDSDDRGFSFAAHEHPLLGFAVCSVCQERAEAAEGDVIDAEDPGGGAAEDGGCGALACSWCGLDEDGLGDGDVRDDVPTSDLMLCDGCPRAFCVRCAIVSLGGNAPAWEAVRGHLRAGEGGEEWLCPACRPTDFLRRLRGAYARMTCESPINVDAGDEGEGGEGPASDGEVQRLLEELDHAESSLEEASRKLERSHLDRERDRIESELVADGVGLDNLEGRVIEGLDGHRRRWRVRFDRVSETISRLQDELDAREPGVVVAYYRCRAKEGGEGGGGAARDAALRDCKISADLELDRRDEREGFGRGEFRGASGYKPRDPRVLKLEPEDLNALCLNEIEDVNTVEGAIEQMESNARRGANPWRSKTGTTDLDIEMFRKKAIRFEEINLGDKIDLELLEQRCVTDKEDAAATKNENATVVRREVAGAVRVVKRSSESLRALKQRARRETTQSRLSAHEQDYQPRLPPQNAAQMPMTVPRVKKRAQLSRVSGGGGSVSHSGRMSPSSERGLLIGDNFAEYEDSDVILEMEDCAGRVTVCKPLTLLLKEHQVDGLKFCWKNVCSRIMKYKREGVRDIHGAILAHNMGLGKSLQAVCLLHTLFTHPLLVTQPAAAGSFGRRIIHRALLIAPVNTLANWETEFQKWVGMDSGKNVPALRFYPWNDQRNKVKIVQEWCSYGGILCISSEKYANACKGFLDADKRGKAPNKANESKPVSAEDDAFMRKCLFNPGPDILVLDEVHSMLKSTTTNIYKVLCGVGTRLRLGLTGSPIQNNLYEYFRMASWVRPECLGTEATFTRKYHDPIMEGMAADCTPVQAEKQEQASNEMHGILAKFVHRRDADVLAKDLPFLQETIIHVRQSRAQTKLYREFRKFQKENDDKGFFRQYHAMRPISNHPACLIFPKDKYSRPSTPTTFGEQKEECIVVTTGGQPRIAPEKYAWICDKCQVAKFRTLDEAQEHEDTCNGTFDQELAPLASIVGNKSQPKKDSENEQWWRSFADRAEKSDLDIKAIEHGGKIVLLLQIIAHCDAIGDKVVVFSQSLSTLSYIEEVLESPDWFGFKVYLPDNVCKIKIGGWRRNQDYLRIDGSVDAKERGDLIDSFHSDSQRSKLFLISTNAGGLGINLIAANRVVLFDSHWNPAVDLQAVYRCYRYGQTKPTYCYRLLAEGSMEEKIYSRAATKTSLADLVIDEKNPERSFTRHEMDLLRIEDTWVCCNACNKWRMLPPETSTDVIDNLPNEWYCKDNVYDRDRSTCDAEERSGSWMVQYFQRRARENDGIYSLSQSSQSSPMKGAAEVLPSFDKRHQQYTERDDVLQTLLARSEEKKTASTNAKDKTGKMRWVAKWDFFFSKGETLEMVEREEEPPKSSSASPKKMHVNPPTKSPTKLSTKSPPKRGSGEKKAKPGRKGSDSPHQDVQLSCGLAGEENKSLRKSPRKRSQLEIQTPANSRSSVRKRKSSESLQEKSNESLSSDKKRKSTRKPAEKGSLETKGKVKAPQEKKAQGGCVVDLTFDSESD